MRLTFLRGPRAGLIISFVALVGCSDPSYDLQNLQPQVEDFVRRAENSLGRATTVYVYPLAEYQRLADRLPSILQGSFKNMQTKQHESRQLEFRTETVSFTKKTEHRMHCKGYLRAAVDSRAALLTIDCEVSSYWTRLKRPPTHSPGDYIDWSSDFYYDKRATLVESVLLQDALRADVGYDLSEVIMTSQPLFDDKALAELLLKAGRPWCGRQDAQVRFPDCGHMRKNASS